MKFLLKAVTFLIILAVLGGIGSWLYKTFLTEKIQVVFSTQPVERKDMINVISATGTVEPEELVNVGAQVAGMIKSFGTDVNGKQVDYGSQVKSGELLAQIDDALYQAELNSAKAQKLQAEASIASAEADIKQATAKYELARQNWERAERLHPENIIAKSEYDSALSEFNSAEAAIAVSKASLAQAKAQLASAEAALEKASWNLRYCVINSPVDGVIIDRRVNIGQTVVSSMSAPSLFLIAKDLRKMQVWVSVNEADIGQIKVGQEALFTVDTFPNLEFKGVVQKIRLNATMSQNVVTFVVEIGTDNSNGILLPYLTANVKFVLARRNHALTVPNSALRFTPDVSLVPEEYRSFSLEEGEKVVWALENGKLRPIAVKTGLNDGTDTEILSGELEENMQVVTGSQTVTKEEMKADEGNVSSPFLPQPPKRSRKK